MRKTQNLRSVLSTALCAVYVLVMVFSTLFHNHSHGTFHQLVNSEKVDHVKDVKSLHGTSDCHACHFLTHQISFESPEIWISAQKLSGESVENFYFQAPNSELLAFYASPRGPPPLSL